jgi:hypothetical protein
MAAINFALSPALAVAGVIDYSSREGRNIFTYATTKLDEELYDCRPEGLYQFLQAIKGRAHEYGWDDEIGGVVHIPEHAADAASETNNLLESYGMISIDQIRAFEETYISQPIRPAQDTYLLYKCLMNSISKEGKSKIMIWSDQYHVQGLPSGTLLLKVIVRESHLDTNATISSIRTKLSSLDSYILTIGADITKFNGYVKLLINSLAARGETTTDLLTNLFKGYLAVNDKTFVAYIGRKQENYEEGDDIATEDLMTMADNKFKLLKEGNRWNAPSADEEKILALHAEIKTLQKQATKAKKSGASPTTYKKKPADTTQKKKGAGERTKQEKPDWMVHSKKPDDPKKPKSWNNKMWHWCSPETGGKCAGNWRCHKPESCEGRAHQFTGKQKPEADAGSNKRLKLAQALSAIQNDSDSENESVASEK